MLVLQLEGKVYFIFNKKKILFLTLKLILIYYLIIIENRKKKINEKELRSRINSLSKPAKKEFDEIDYKLDPTLRYSTLSDAKELTFKPKIGNGKAKKSRADDDDGNDSKSDDVILRFVRRQEDREKSKRDELDSQIGKFYFL